MKILHHITSSPTESNALACALRFIKPDDTLLLAGNAVAAMLHPAWRDAVSNLHLCLMKTDVEARGLNSQLATFRQIDYPEFVAQTLTHSKVITW
ncbi:sulfurtransferase complex subunit TusB [Shewanella dokdonensis]|uniref:Sulfurtransferase complex subunit TusB n=1 Tax=Shewanella dokdonensis TaxID=712036 RepID=A0ABX8DEE8_9GAMM|nr:sulfurtransferase complex subunit TusB [Shewanella dokdonensis]QVK23103.1 sulfurtransferase complex subunit TusB [Shewanella dokdonensis]